MDNPLSFKSIIWLCQRNQWHLAAVETLKDCDIVFLDPDNGLEIKSCSKTRRASIKHVFYVELSAYYTRGQSLVIYDHRDRKKESEYEIRYQNIKYYDIEEW